MARSRDMRAFRSSYLLRGFVDLRWLVLARHAEAPKTWEGPDPARASGLLVPVLRVG
jgi:hypothetical protein